MSDVQVLTEKRFFTELLRMYKKHRCLWDQTHVKYHNKESRKRANAQLLEKYKTINKDATMDTLRRKIENMRAVVRRQRKKVIASKMRNEEPCYTPRLWYYKHLLFLEDQFKGQIPKTDQSSDSDDSEEESIEVRSGLETNSSNQPLDEERNDGNRGLQTEYDESDTDVPKPKTPALVSRFVDNEEDTKNNTFIDFVSTTRPNAPASEAEESEAYGRSVGLQLKQLDSFQRTVAEKIISDAIFYARLNKLSANSCINLNTDKYN